MSSWIQFVDNGDKALAISRVSHFNNLKEGLEKDDLSSHFCKVVVFFHFSPSEGGSNSRESENCGRGFGRGCVRK